MHVYLGVSPTGFMGVTTRKINIGEQPSFRVSMHRISFHAQVQSCQVQIRSMRKRRADASESAPSSASRLCALLLISPWAGEAPARDQPRPPRLPLAENLEAGALLPSGSECGELRTRERSSCAPGKPEQMRARGRALQRMGRRWTGDSWAASGKEGGAASRAGGGMNGEEVWSCLHACRRQRGDLGKARRGSLVWPERRPKRQ